MSHNQLTTLRTVLILTALLLLGWAGLSVLQYHQTKQQIRHLFFQEARAMATLLVLGEQAMTKAARRLEEEQAARLVTAGYWLRDLETLRPLTSEDLQRTADSAGIFNIVMFDDQGRREMGLRGGGPPGLRGAGPRDSSGTVHEGVMQFLQSGSAHTVEGLHPGRGSGGLRFSVLVRRNGGGAVMLNIEAQAQEKLFNDYGPPAWLSEFARQPDVRYVQRKAGGVMQEQYGKEEAVPAEEVFAVESPLPDHPRESLTVGFDNHPIRENDRILFQRMLLSVGVMGFLAFIMLVWIRLQKNYAFQSRLLRQVQSYHRTVLDTMRDAVLAWEPAGSMTFWNPRAQKLFPVLASLPLQGTLPGSIQALRERVREHPREDTVDLQEEERGLRRFRVEETYIPEPMPTRVLFLTDVTDVENATREQDRREYWETLAQIASGVAHEVRNPLNAIDMTIQTICMEPSTLNAGDRETLESVRGEIRRINAMVEHFLAYGRPRPPVFAEMDLNAVARDVAQFLAPLLQEKNLRITLEAAPLPGIQADAQQIKQALLNIALNAIDASPPGTELSFQTSIAEDGVFFRCRDHGQGMTPDQVQKIFDPYVTFKPGGTGLGLSIVKRILDSHGGTIQVTSQPEAGTTVTLRIPLSQES